MALEFLDHLNLNGSELQNASLQKLNTAPASPFEGQTYYNTVSKKAFVYTGTEWTDLTSQWTANAVSQATNSSADWVLKVSAGADRTARDYSWADWMVKTVAWVATKATAWTDYTTSSSTETFTNKTLDGANNTFGNIPVLSLLQSDIIKSTWNLSNADDWTLVSSLRFKNEIDSVRSYADGLIASNDAMVLKGGIDCSTNPNFPAGNAWESYRVTVAWKIGGASWIKVEVGDLIQCFVDNTATWDFATVGASWLVLQTNIDLATASTSWYVSWLATSTEAEAKTWDKAVTPASLVNFPIKKTFNVWDGTSTTITLTHNLWTKDLAVKLRRVSDGVEVLTTTAYPTVNTVTLTFMTAPTLNSLVATIIG